MHAFFPDNRRKCQCPAGRPHNVRGRPGLGQAGGADVGEPLRALR